MVCYNKFVNRRQLSGEKAVVYMSELRLLTSSCNFEGMTATTVLYQFVCCLRNADLQAKLFSEKELMAMKALEVVQLVELSEENVIQVRNLCGRCTQISCCCIRKPGIFASQCAVVGNTAAKCPLPRNSLKCQKCGKGGHVMKACKQRVKSALQSAKADCVNFVDNVTVVVASSEVHSPTVTPLNVDAHASSLHDESLFLSSDRALSLCIKPYSVRVQVNKVLKQFEIDSGCSETFIHLDTYTTNFANSVNGPALHQMPVGLRTWASQSLTIIGEFQAVVKYKHFTCNLPVLVMDGIGPNHLGCNWFQAFDISIQGVYFLSPDTSYAGMSNEAFSHTIMNLPAVSGHGTGCYKGPPLHIDINSAVFPVYQRAQSVAFTTKMEEAIAANAKGVIWISVNHAGPWASAIVPVLKRSGTFRLCADYKGMLNRALSSDTYKSPTVDQVLSELAGGCIYGTIDLEEAYTQILVDGETTYVLTVNTVQGLHSVKRLPFGIKIASSAF
ncbi:hypothetical protein PR048_000855 [Dryococelus australis]|uniref:CCHC-type domain-containing protein n=1 Tax=Dryococelus australis TaxID=614101 RepID=A0ABQ9IFQ5_9NEOP|nr:hypothetical protein PR048_000855 [Dryococelus australis]